MSDIPPSPTPPSGASGQIRSVANLTRRDGEEFLALVGDDPLRIEVEYPLERANEALADLRGGRVPGRRRAQTVREGPTGWRT